MFIYVEAYVFCMIRDIHEVKECPDCASLNIIYSDRREQVICKDCGLIFEPLIPMLEERFERSHLAGKIVARAAIKKSSKGKKRGKRIVKGKKKRQ